MKYLSTKLSNSFHNFTEYSVTTRYESNSLHMQKNRSAFILCRFDLKKKRNILKNENFSDISSALVLFVIVGALI